MCSKHQSLCLLPHSSHKVNCWDDLYLSKHHGHTLSHGEKHREHAYGKYTQGGGVRERDREKERERESWDCPNLRWYQATNQAESWSYTYNTRHLESKNKWYVCTNALLAWHIYNVIRSFHTLSLFHMLLSCNFMLKNTQNSRTLTISNNNQTLSGWIRAFGLQVSAEMFY